MSDWKDIVVENSSGELGNINVNKAGGLSAKLSISQGGLGTNSGFNGIWGQASGLGRFTPVLAKRSVQGTTSFVPALPDLQNFFGIAPADYYDYHTVDFTGRKQYVLAKSPVGEYDEDEYPYYFYEWGSKEGVLSIENLMPNVIPCRNETVGHNGISDLGEAETPSQLVTQNVIFDNGQTEETAISVDVRGTLAFDGTDTASILSSAGAWTDSGNQTVTNDATITFQADGDLDALEATTAVQHGAGFRAYNVGTTSVTQFISRGDLSTVDNDSDSDIKIDLDFFVDDTTTGGYSLSFSYLEDNGTKSSYQFGPDNIQNYNQDTGTNQLTLGFSSGNLTGWTRLVEYINTFSHTPRVSDIKFIAFNQKKSIQFGLSCDDYLDINSNNGISRNYNEVYPSFISMCGDVSVNTSDGSQNGSFYASKPHVIMTASSNQETGLIGGITVSNGKPKLRIE